MKNPSRRMGRVNRKNLRPEPTTLPQGLREESLSAFLKSEAQTAIITTDGQWAPVELTNREEFEATMRRARQERFINSRPKVDTPWVWRFQCECGYDGGAPTLERHGGITALVVPRRRWQDRETGKMDTIPPHAFVDDPGVRLGEVYECRKCQQPFMFMDWARARELPNAGYLQHVWETRGEDGKYVPRDGDHVTIFTPPSVWERIPTSSFAVGKLERKVRGKTVE